MTDTGKFIRTRLLNISKKENLSFQLVIMDMPTKLTTLRRFKLTTFRQVA